MVNGRSKNFQQCLINLDFDKDKVTKPVYAVENDSLSARDINTDIISGFHLYQIIRHMKLKITLE